MHHIRHGSSFHCQQSEIAHAGPRRINMVLSFARFLLLFFFTKTTTPSAGRCISRCFSLLETLLKELLFVRYLFEAPQYIMKYVCNDLATSREIFQVWKFHPNRTRLH